MRRSLTLMFVLAACGGEPGSRGDPLELAPGDGSGTDAGDDLGSSSGEDPGGTSTSGADDGDGDSTSTGDTGSLEGTEGESTGVENACPRVQIDVGFGSSVNVRPDPSTAGEPVGSLAHGTIVDLVGEAIGEDIEGNDLWYQIETSQLQGWITAAFAACTLEEPPELDPNGWYLPLQCGVAATVSQGNFGNTSHQGTSGYAFDFAIPLGTPLVAIADGVVTHTFDETGPGDPCYNGGDSSCSGAANYVTLLHADGTKSVYMHLQEVHVDVGETVSLGNPVGLSGSTGWSTGRHAHVMRMEDCGGSYCQSIALAFNDVAGNGVPVSGDMVTSGNCP